MDDSDSWRADGSFRGLQGKSGGGGKGGKGGKGPEFTRVIPKFLRKYHEPPAIQAKFASPPMPEGETGEAEEELDDVQKAAIAEFLEKDKAKKDGVAAAAGAGDGDAGDGDDAPKGTATKKKASQAVVGVGAGAQQPKKKRKRKEMATLSNKKLLSFSMDDEE
ncbi:hypothetical protein Gpo141_00008764 [Globisporangium polare]